MYSKQYPLNLKRLAILFLMLYGQVVWSQKLSFAKNSQLLKDSLALDLPASVRGKLLGKYTHLIVFSDAKKANELALEQFQIGKKINDTLLMAESYRIQGLSSAILLKYHDAVLKYDLCVDLAKKIRNDQLLAKAYNLLGGMYADLNVYEKSIECYTKGLDYAILSKNENTISVGRNNLADIYIKSGFNLEKAENLFLQSLVASEANQSWTTLALSSSNLAEYYQSNGQLGKSDKYMRLAEMNMLKDTTNQFAIANISNALAQLNFKKSNYSSSLYYAQKAKQIFENLSLYTNMLYSQNLIAKNNFYLSNLDQANLHANLLLTKATAIKDYTNMKESHELLYLIEKKKGNMGAALAYYEKYKQWCDTLDQRKKLEELRINDFKVRLAERNAEIRYATERKELENLKLKNQNSNLKRNSIISIVLLCLLGGFIYHLIETSRLKKKLYSELEAEKIMVEQQVKDKTILIQEVHHRVKNNLTMINSLLYLQSKDVESEETKIVLDEFQKRIRSIALVHNKLYDEENISSIDFNSYIQEVFNELNRFSKQKSKRITLDINGTSRPIEINSAVTLGLIFNELMTNSLKYAFSEIEEGKISVHIFENKDNTTILYSDNGPGLDFDFNTSNGNFGFKLLKLLPKQINGELNYINNEKGHYFELKMVRT